MKRVFVTVVLILLPALVQAASGGGGHHEEHHGVPAIGPPVEIGHRSGVPKNGPPPLMAESWVTHRPPYSLPSFGQIGVWILILAVSEPLPWPPNSRAVGH